MRRLAVLLLLVVTVSCRLEADGEPDLFIDCKYMTPKKMFNLCIVQTKGSKNTDVVFHLHGVTGNQKHWVENFKEVREIWRKNGMDAPAVATVNFGPTWFLAEKNSSPYSGLFNFYINDIMPWIENRLGYKPGRKLLLGESMGGFNAAQLYFKRPDIWDKVAIICPAFTMWGPQSSKEEVEDYVKRNNANKGYINWLRAGWKAFFPKASDWSNADVFQLVNEQKEKYPPLFLSVGTEDDFGFYEGTSKMAEILSSRGDRQLTWYPLAGKHCARPHEQLADFLIN